MSSGLKALLDAAQYLEQMQDKQVSLSEPVDGETHYLRHLPAAPFDIYGRHNNNNNISTRNAVRHTSGMGAAAATATTAGSQQVSSSAPAASATFQHTTNGLTISSGGSQLITVATTTAAAAAAAAAAATNQQRHNSSDYEYSNGNAGVTVVASGTSPTTAALTTSPSAAGAVATAATNGRSSEGRMSEDAFPSNTSNSATSPNSNSNAFRLLSAAINSHEKQQKQQQQLQEQSTSQQHQHEQTPQRELMAAQQPPQQQPPPPPPHNINNNNNTKLKQLRPVDGICLTNAAASKQMLLNDGLRVASPAATIGSSSGGGGCGTPSKAINIPLQQLHGGSKLASLPFALVSSSSLPRYNLLTLTPPPASSRKVEPHSRIRSFSLSSRKLSATQLHGLHNGDLNHNMIVEDGRPMPYLSNGTGSGSGSGTGGHSPPRGGISGSHYLQMMTSQQSGAGSQLTHGTPSLGGGGGRRRTISSNSNGAGTREVHNKLEKNRRAHLKECYETLKRELPLKDEDRKKTSNLAILGEALKCVTTLQKQEQDLEAQVEQLAKDKINSQRRIKMLRRELGPNYEPMFAVMFPDTDVASERETLNDNTSLSSGRGSILYSSSSSLSSGGSNGSTTLSSSPVGAGMQTAMPTAISPVISKTNSNSTNTTAVGSVVANGSGSLMTVAATSPNSGNMLQLQQQQQPLKTSTSASANNSPAGSPTAVSLNGSGVVNANVNVSVNGGSTPLSLTAKNISAMSLTRGSPTPSTPSPSPSSSSCVSSSSSLISSSSPPMALNGVINGRNVTVSIPSNLKFSSGGTGGATIGNGTASAAATIIAATTPPSASGINAITAATNSNNARAGAVAVTANANANATAPNASTSLSNSLASPTATIATTMATITATAINNAYRAHAHAPTHSRKTSLSFAGDEAKKQGDGLSVLGIGIGLGPGGADGHNSYENGEQPAKFIKVYNGVVTSAAGDSATKQMPSISMVPINNAIGQLQLSQVVGGGSLVVSPTGYIAAAVRSLVHPAQQQQQQQQQQKILLSSGGNAKHTANGGNGDGSASELGRLPGGAELNILPVISSSSGGNSGGSSLKINGAFYHANGKLTPLVNGGGNNGILLKDGTSAGAALTPLIVTATAAPNSANAVQPNGGGNGLHYTANFAQLLAATAATNGAAGATSAERSNSKLSRSLGGLEPPLARIKAFRCGPSARPCTQRQ